MDITTITKYIAIRETAGMNARTYRRYEEYEDEELAIAWFAGSDLGACRTVSIYAVKFDKGENLRTLKPSEKRNIPNVGTLVYRKRNDKVLFDIREQESKAPAEPEHEEAKAEPVMSKWRVSSNGWGEDKSREEAKAYADKLNAGIDPDAEVEETMEEAEMPANGSDVVCYYVVLKIAENRKHTKFHYKRRTFLDDEDAIRFARSRLRGGCVSASVYMYDPVVTRYPPEVFESTSAQRDARDILRLLPDTKIFYASRTMAMDLRDVVHDWLTQRRETA